MVERRSEPTIPDRVLRVGLTGGIASGKTTVGRYFAELGALVIDADRIAHEVQAPGTPAYDAVVERFGPRVVAEDGSIDRKALGAIVFSDADARADLNAIVHPAVRREATRRAAEQIGDRPVAMFDAALLVETGAYRGYDRLVVVRCSVAEQRARLERRGLDDAEIDRRLASQLPTSEKVAKADYVIDTDGAKEVARRRAVDVWQALLRDREALKPGL